MSNSPLSCAFRGRPQLMDSRFQSQQSRDFPWPSIIYVIQLAFTFQQFFAVLVDFARNTIAFRPSSGNISRRATGDCYGRRQEGPKPDRQTRWQPGAHAPLDACNEPGEAGRRTRPYLPAGTEIRERHEPHRGEPAAANLPHFAGTGGVLLRGRTEPA